MKIFRIPDHDTAPSEEMIDWLGTCTQDWEGDESGIRISVPFPLSADGVFVDTTGGPGDFVAELDMPDHEVGLFVVLPAALVREGFRQLSVRGPGPDQS